MKIYTPVGEIEYNSREELLDKIAIKMWGRTKTEASKKQVCVCCGQPANKFRDTLSTKEYTISGFCQKCQDKTFGR